VGALPEAATLASIIAGCEGGGQRGGTSHGTTTHVVIPGIAQNHHNQLMSQPGVPFLLMQRAEHNIAALSRFHKVQPYDAKRKNRNTIVMTRGFM